jgi:hypothetical protein
MVLEKLRAIKTYHAAQIEGNHAQPKDVAGYVDTVRRLKMILDIRIIEKAQRELGSRFASSPRLWSLFSIGEKGMFLRGGVPKNDRLLWLGQELYEKKGAIPPNMLTLEINRLAQQDKKQKDRITPMVSRFIADLGMAYELRSRLRVICPQLFDAETRDERTEAEDMGHYWSQDRGILALHDLKMINGPSHAPKKMVRLGDIGHPSCFPYPVHKNRTRANVETMQASERQLDRFEGSMMRT